MSDNNNKVASNSTINLIGLGGTGCNVIENYIKDPSFIERLKGDFNYKFNAIALDIAEKDLNSLKDTYRDLQDKLKKEGISQDRIFIGLNTIKFNGSKVLEGFIKRNPSLFGVDNNNIKSNNIKSVNFNTIKIPNLAGGVGRKRGLSRALFISNYMNNPEINSLISQFGTRVNSTNKNVIITVFGVGGGTGSGMVVDMAKYIKKQLPNVNIFGLAIVPSQNDDGLSRGPSPYMALNEFKILFDNESITKYGFENPFTTMFFLPLEVTVSETHVGDMASAWSVMDNEINEILRILEIVDIEDIMSELDMSENMKDQYINSVGYLKVRYPIKEYIDVSEMKISRAGLVGTLIDEKIKFMDASSALLDVYYIRGFNIFKQHIIATGGSADDPNVVVNQIDELVKRNIDYGNEINRMIRNMQIFNKQYVDIFMEIIETIEILQRESETAAEPDELKNSNSNSINKTSTSNSNMTAISLLRTQFSNLGKIKEQSDLDSILLEMIKTQRSLDSMLNEGEGKLFTSSQQQNIVKSMRNFIGLAIKGYEIMKKYYIIKYLYMFLQSTIKVTVPDKLDDVSQLLNNEIVNLIRYISIVLGKIEQEYEMVSDYLIIMDLLKSNYKKEKDLLNDQLSDTDYKIKEIDRSIKIIDDELKSTGFLRGKNKKTLEKDRANAVSSMNRLIENKNLILSDIDSVDKMIKIIDTIKDYANVTGTAHKTLSNILKLNENILNTISIATKRTYYYEQIIDISPREARRIMGVILNGRKESLLNVETIRKIVDMAILEEKLKSYVGVFRSASYFGLNSNYTTDRVLGIITSSISVSNEVIQNLKSELEIYSPGQSVNNVVSIKSIPIPQATGIESWLIKFLLIATKAKPEDLSVYDMIKKSVIDLPPERLEFYKALTLSFDNNV
ncbi:MAG: tubulin-like doman-containing protein [Thermoplasmata archaeon]